MTENPQKDVPPRGASPADDPHTLVSAGWLARHLADADLRILDASWYLPGPDGKPARDAQAEFAAGHIPGARFCGVDALSDPDPALPHMVPPEAAFRRAMEGWGIGGGARIVVYDGAGIYSAARVWWLCRLMGLGQVAVLDGGLPAWRAGGHPIETGAQDGPARQPVRAITIRRNPALVRDMAQVETAVQAHTHTILDARAAGRFRGEVPEPRPGLRSGHIPGARNIPFDRLLNPDQTMKSPAALREVFAAARVDLASPVISCCGSGVTAAIIDLALARISHPDHAIYDGSWAEWGRRDGPAIATGD